MIDFTVDKLDTNSPQRRGQVQTGHGTIQTPAVLPWSIAGTLGSLSGRQCQALGIQALALDVLPLCVRPGLHTVQQAGGLGQFFSCDLPLMSFSGLFPAADHLKKNMTQLGVRYQAAYTKAYQRLSALQADQLASQMGADLRLPLFQTVDYYAPVDDLKRAVEVNLAWQEQANSDWSVLMGGGLRRLRSAMASRIKTSAVLIANLPADDLAEYRRIIQVSIKLLPPTALRAAVANNEEQLLTALAAGVDLVIWRHALKAANHGTAYDYGGSISLRQANYANVTEPLIDGYRPSFIHYLHHEGSMTANDILNHHNLSVLVDLLRKWRQTLGHVDSESAIEALQRAITSPE